MIDNIVGCDLSSCVFLRFLRNKITASSNLFYFIFMNWSTFSCIIIVILNYYISCFFEIPALHVASNDILNNDDHECEALIHELSICSFIEFRVFLRFLRNEIASSSDFSPSCAWSVHTCVIAIVILPSFMYYWDSYTVGLLHPMMFFIYWFSWMQSAHRYVVVVSTLPNFIYFWDS